MPANDANAYGPRPGPIRGAPWRVGPSGDRVEGNLTLGTGGATPGGLPWLPGVGNARRLDGGWSSAHAGRSQARSGRKVRAVLSAVHR